MLTRRRFLTLTSLAVPAALATTSLVPETAVAAPEATPGVRHWLDWIAEHRDTVAVAADPGTGRTLTHRQHRPHVLASTIKVVHLAGYASAVAERRLDPEEPIKVGDWDAHHPYVSDGGAHRAALTALGIPCDDYGIADDPEQTVPLDALAAAMIDFSDNAATDYLRVRLGDRALHRAAAAGGWHRPDLRSLQGEVLQLILPECAAPAGAPAALRRAIGDRLAARFVRDLKFRDQVFARIPEMPQTTDEQWPWTRGHGRGTAAQLAGMHHALAGGRFRPRQALPIVHGHLERALAPLTPEGADGVGFKGGSLPRTLNLGLSVRWQDGRTGVLALMLSGVSDADLGDPATDALRLGFEVLTRPELFAQLAEALHP